MPGRETIGTAIVKVLADLKDFGDSVERQIKEQAPQFEKAGEGVGKDFHTGIRKSSDKETDKTMEGLRARIKRWEGKFQKSGNGIGRAFGKGARNDLVNFFGGFMSIVPKAMEVVLKSIGWVADKVREFGDRFKQAQAAGSGFVSSLAQAGLPGLIALIGVAVSVIGTFVVALGPLASALVLTTGLVLALAGSIGFALVGALVAVGGALVPFAAAIGVAALAMAGLDKKSQTFKDLKKDWKDLKKEVSKAVFGPQEGFFGPKGSDNLTALHDILRAVRPLILSVAGAVGQLLASFGAAARGKEFATLMKDIGAVIGPMVTQLGAIGGNLLTFFGEAFVAASPIIKEFLGWLGGVTQALADMGKGGTKSPLADFFNKAWDSAKKVGALVQEILGLVGDLFSAGKGTGDSIFVTLTEKVKEFRDWLQRAKEDGTLQKFFDDAKLLGTKLGEITTAVGDLIAELDNSGSRGLLFFMLDALEAIIKAITWTHEKWTAMVLAIAETAVSIGLAIGSAFAFLTGDTIPNFIDRTVEKFAGLASRIGGAIGNLASTFANWVKGVVAKFTALVSKIVATFANLAGKIITKAGSIASRFATWVTSLPGKAKTIATQIINAFSGLAGKIIAKAGSIASKVATWFASLPGKAKTAASSIANAFSGLAGDIIAKAGSISSKISTWFSGLYQKGLDAGREIVRGFTSALSGILNNISLGSLNIPASVRALIPGLASGGIVFGPHVRMIGEAGPEAVVPLNRPLSMVDPAVRELSAIAQGLRSPTGGTDVNTRANRTLVGSITIITPTEDPRAVASEVVARMAGASYL